MALHLFCDIDNTFQAQTAECLLSVRVATHDAGKLSLRYRVQNQSPLALYLCNRLWNNTRVNPATRQEIYELTPNAAHVHAAADHVNVRLAVVDVDLADGLKTFSVPCLTRLEPGRDYEGLVELELPLIPYVKAEPAFSDGISAHVLPLRFSLGYFLADDSIASTVFTVETTAGGAYLVPPFVAKSEQVATVDLPDEHVEVATNLAKIRNPWSEVM